MAETEGYAYIIVVELPSDQPVRPLMIKGDYTGRSPEEAIEAAVADGGLPREDGGRVIAVPRSRWHERDVVIEQVPQVRVIEPTSNAVAPEPLASPTPEAD